MSFLSRKKPEADSKIVLPITPMLDMTFQLLFFFIINFKPMPAEGVMDTALPTEKVTQAHNQKDVKEKAAPEKEKEPEFQSDLTVQVRTQGGQGGSGDISAISVQNNEGKVEPVGTNLAALRSYLKEKRKTLANKDAIKVQGDGTLKIGNFIAVRDVCHECGFKDISLVAPEDFGAGR